MTIARILASAALTAVPTVALAQDAGPVRPNGITYNVQTWGDPATGGGADARLDGHLAHLAQARAALGRRPLCDRADMRAMARPDKPMRAMTPRRWPPISGRDGHPRGTGHTSSATTWARWWLCLCRDFPEASHSMTYLDEPLVGFNLDQFTTYREEILRRLLPSLQTPRRGWPSC